MSEPRVLRRVEWALALLAFTALTLHHAETLNRPFGLGKGNGERIASRWMGYGTREGARIPLREGCGLLVWERYPEGSGRLHYYGNHPPLAGWMARASWTLLPHGEGSWLSDEGAIRLPFLLCTLATALVLALISPTAMLLFASMRGCWFEGALPNFEIPCLLFATLAALLMAKGKSTRWIFSALFLATLADWTAAFLLLPFAAILWRRGRARGLVFLGSAVLLAGMIHFLLLWVATGNAGSAFEHLAGAVGKTGAFQGGTTFEELAQALRRHAALVCGIPALGLAVVGLLALLIRSPRNALVPGACLLAVALLNVLVFRNHALIHEAWIHYLIVPAALFGAGLVASDRMRPSLRLLLLLPVLAVGTSEALAGREARVQCFTSDPIEVARSLDAGFATGDLVLTTEDFSASLFYAETFATRLIDQTPRGLSVWMEAHPSTAPRYLVIFPKSGLEALLAHCESTGFPERRIGEVRIYRLP